MHHSLGNAAAGAAIAAAIAYRVGPLQYRSAASAGAAALALVFGYLRAKRRSNTRSLAHENILILGASSGVGKELAIRYACSRRAVSLHLVARRPLDLDMFSRSTTEGQDTVDIASTQADVTKPEDVARLAEEVAKRWKRVDTIIIWCVEKGPNIHSRPG